MRKSNYLWLLLAAVCGTMLFHTSQQVTDGRTKLAGIQAKAEKEDETIRVLEAEWSYLNQPDRLEKLSRQYLALEPLKGRQFGKIADLENRPVADAPAEAPAGVAAVAEAETATVKAEPVAAVSEAKLPAPEAAKTDTSKTDTGKTDSVKLDKASVTAGIASPVLGTKPAVAAKPAVKPAAAKPVAAKPARGYVYSPPYKPPYAAPAQSTAYHPPYHPAPYAAPVTTSTADSGRGFDDVMKSLGVH